MNRLSEENSPYLLQHADNPVDWMPWGRSAFERAEELDRPVFLSIGYSTCHWCHVMEDESFSDGALAALMNESFVCVKVDREERPDVDSLYMRAALAMTGAGGWPLNVFLTPQGAPFYAATYIPRSSALGRQGMLELLPAIARAWTQRRGEIEESAAKLSAATEIEVDRSREECDEATSDRTLDQLQQRFDSANGGFGGAPKFPMPHAVLFLVRRARRTGQREPLEMAVETLRAIHRGGVYDQIGLGLHRYSTDARWHLPHFEKMLYDQAMIVMAAVEAWEASRDREVRRLAERTLDYMLRCLRHPEGGFCSAEDADSPEGEGAFYTWKASQLREHLDEPDYALACRVWGVSEAGNYSEEASRTPSGRNVLDAREGTAPSKEEAAELERIRLQLLRARAARPRPALDDKILTDWNGLAIAALARAGRSFDEYGYVRVAEETAQFITSELTDGQGNLLHSWRQGSAGVEGLAADHAFLAWGLLELHQATQDHRYLQRAVELCDRMESEFSHAGGAYSITGRSVESKLPSRPVEMADGALPSANSVSLQNLQRIWRLTGDSAAGRVRDRLSSAFKAALGRSPAGYSMAMAALEEILTEAVDVVVCGDPERPETSSLLEEARRCAGHSAAVLLRRPDDRLLDRVAPHTKGMDEVDGEPAAYICRGFSCGLPVTDPEEIAAKLCPSTGGGRP